MEAVRNAALAVAAGEYEYVLAIGAEKMRDVGSRESLVARTANLTHPTLAKGRTGPGGFALIANRYFETYGRGTDDTAAVAVKNHEHATRNPIAQFSTPVTKEQVLNSPLVADPLRLLDCTPTTDGAAAVILTSVERARELGRPFAIIEGVGLAVIGGYYDALLRPRQRLARRQVDAARRRRWPTRRPTSPTRGRSSTWSSATTASRSPRSSTTKTCSSPGAAKAGRCWRKAPRRYGGDLPVNLSGRPAVLRPPDRRHRRRAW